MLIVAVQTVRHVQPVPMAFKMEMKLVLTAVVQAVLLAVVVDVPM